MIASINAEWAMADTITFEREALYAEVWTDPVSTVSKRYRLSDNGLRKICKKLGVPLPPIGYWAKLRSGQKVRKLTLPVHSGPTTCVAWPEANTHRFSEPDETKDYRQLIDEEEALPENRVQPTADSEWRHKLVRALAKKLDAVDKQIAEEAKPRKQNRGEPHWDHVTWMITKPGGLIDVGGEFLSLIVSPAIRQRALSIADGFLIAVEQRGFKVRIEEGKTLITCEDVAVHFRMSEMAKNTREGYAHDTWDALGRLRIILRSATYASAAPSEIKARDESDKRLEDQLNDVLARLRRAVVGYEGRDIRRKEAAIDAKIESRRQEHRRWHDEMATIAARREREALDAAIAESERWAIVDRGHRYLVHIESQARERHLSVDSSTAVGQWLERTRAALDMMDPTDARLSLTK
jgi:hypothetical protein